MRAEYADGITSEIAAKLERTSRSVYQQARLIGLNKSAEFFKTVASGRLQTDTARGKSQRFTPGMKPWNTGKKGWKAGGRSAETRFKAGERHGAANSNYKPIGTLRINANGHLERKVNDTDPVPVRRWKPIYQLVWIAANGPIPKGHIVRFKDGQKTAVLEQITVDRLECITKRENMNRNTSWSKYPHEIAQLIQLKGAITRQVNRINKEAKEAA